MRQAIKKIKPNKVAQRIIELCNYTLSGIEREELQNKHIELQKAWRRVRTLEKELNAILEKYK